MQPLYNVNGLVFWNEQEIRFRNYAVDYLATGIRDALLAVNPAWRTVQVEAPLLTPRGLLSDNYGPGDMFADLSGSGLALRPETTPGSYAAARHMLDTHSGVKPPMCVWQWGKSFRREQDQPYSHMRLKEFYQAEWQCIYTSDTKADYHAEVIEPVGKMIAALTGHFARVAPSDRLPAYSQKTIDVEIKTPSKWMEVCSISLRTDFPGKYRAGSKERDLLVVEIAVGLDRLIHARFPY